MKIKKGDTVKVIAGKDKGAEGKVIQVLREEQRVIVEGVNRVKKHTKVVNQGGRAGNTGGIVTAAALLISVVFAGFVFGGFAPIKAIGLGLVLAVLLDATIVRMLMVPATMTLLGRLNWWLPRPLERLHTRLAMTEEPAALELTR
jgi:ribosomal protein L24